MLTPKPWTAKRAYYVGADPDEFEIVGTVPGLGECRLANVYDAEHAALIALTPDLLDLARELAALPEHETPARFHRGETLRRTAGEVLARLDGGTT
jgi:hypothetical protein